MRYDHSAPWHCSLEGCTRCDGKPSYGEWWVAVQTRQIEPPVKRVRWLPPCDVRWCTEVARYEVPEYRGGPRHYWCDKHRPLGSLARSKRLRLRHGR